MKHPHAEETVDPAATLAAWRARGDHRHDPVRFRFIEALVERAAAHEGDARKLLDGKAAALLAAYGDAMEKKACAADAAVVSPAQPGALSELNAYIAVQTAQRADDPTAPDVEALAAYFSTLWTRLSAERRLTQSQETVPENAGPLNSHNLVHRSLTLMRELSPEYLNQFMAYVDALLWLDQANAAQVAAAAEGARAEGGRKSGRGKAG